MDWLQFGFVWVIPVFWTPRNLRNCYIQRWPNYLYCKGVPPFFLSAHEFLGPSMQPLGCCRVVGLAASLTAAAAERSIKVPCIVRIPWRFRKMVKGHDKVHIISQGSWNATCFFWGIKLDANLWYIFEGFPENDSALFVLVIQWLLDDGWWKTVVRWLSGSIWLLMVGSSTRMMM